MTALVASHVNNIIKSSNKGWKQCSCCPYGYHIDLDFVRYCENVVNCQLLPRAVGQSRKPKKRASMDVLLGLPDNYIRSSREVKEKEHTISAWDGLEQAVEDFELTLRRASKPGKGITSNLDHDQDTKGDWFRSLQIGVPWRKRVSTQTTPRHEKKTGNIHGSVADHGDWLRRDTIRHTSDSSVVWQDKFTKNEADTSEKTEREGGVCEDTPDNQITSSSDSKSKETLETIRQQVASSLPEIKRLEEQVKQVPLLQGEITRLKNENMYLSNKLNLAETNETDVRIKTPAKTEDASPKKRNIAIGTSIVTRDVGVSHRLPLTTTCGVMTDHYEPTPLIRLAVTEEDKSHVSSSVQTDKYYEVSLSHRSSQTMLKMDTVYSSEDLERNIDKAIKLYEKNFHHLLHPKKPFLINCGVQVDMRTTLRRDYGVQVRQETSSCGTSFKPECRNSNVQTMPERVLRKDIGVSNDTVANTCRQCCVKKTSVGTVTHIDKDLKLISLGASSTILGNGPNKKTSRSIAVGPDKSVCSSKSTDTRELNTKKDVAINTTKNKLVDTAVDPISRPPTSLRRRGSISKIPRLVTSPKRSKSLVRQDTYLVSPSSSRKSYESEDFDFESEPEEGEYSSLKFDTHSRPLSSEPVFQSVRIPDVHRERKSPSQEIKGALKVLNDGLVKVNDVNLSNSLRNTLSIVQQEWFKISSAEQADPLAVEDYMDCFEELSKELLRFIVNMVDDTGNTAMHYAVSHGHFDVVSVLLDSKVCDVNKKNAAGYTCIMLVSLVETESIAQRQVVRRLFQLADVNSRAKQHGQTALMLAVSHGRIDMVELLLDSGADMNVQDDDGSTALMCAAEHGHVDIVKFMLTRPECDLTITDCDGNTALNIAMEAGNRDIGVLLYAQQHFSRGGSPYTSFKAKKPLASDVTSRPAP